MQSNKHFAIGIAATIAVAAMASILFIWPNYREARAVRAQVAELEGRVIKLASRTEEVERLAAERGVEMHTATLRELDELWDKVKSEE